jgi:hypothetical protein
MSTKTLWARDARQRARVERGQRGVGRDARHTLRDKRVERGQRGLGERCQAHKKRHERVREVKPGGEMPSTHEAV